MSPESPQVRICRIFSLVTGSLAVLVGALVIVGWACAIPAFTTVFPGLVSMKPNTAVCFLLVGLSLWCLRLRTGQLRPARLFLRLSQLFSVVVAGTGLLTFAEYLSSVDTGIDAAIFHHTLIATHDFHPGRMAEASALGVCFLGSSLLLLEAKGGLRYLSQFFALLTVLDGLTAFVGYIYGVRELYGLFNYSSMAFHSASLFILLGMSALAARPEFGLMATFTSQRLGGLMLRRLLPLAVVIPIFIGWARWKAQLAGYFGTVFGIGVFALSNVVMFAIVLTVSATWINRVDEKRRRAEESDLRLAAIVASSSDAIIGKDLNGIITSWNQSAERLFGYPAGEIIGRSMTLLIPPDRQHEERHILDRIRHGERVEPFETIRIRKDGQLIDVSATISPVCNPEGQVIGAAKIVRDITQSKRVAEELRQQAEILDLAQVLVRDMEGHVVLWNTGAQKLYGFTREEAQGQFSEQLLQTVFPRALRQIEEQVLNSGRWEGELNQTRRDGRQIVVSSIWVLQRDAHGDPFRILESCADITERKLAQQQLELQAGELSRQAQELANSEDALAMQTRMLQCVLDNIGDGVIAANTEGKFLLWNPAADRILGQSRQDIPPAEWSERLRIYRSDQETLFPPDQFPLARAIAGHEARAEMFVRDANSERGAWIEVTARPLRDEGGSLMGGVAAFRDITQRKLADREIRKLNTDLEQRVLERTAQLEIANRELESFSYSVSHDLRAPLRHISGFAKILREDFAAAMDSEARKCLVHIEDGALNMSRLVDELLNLSRLGRQQLSRQLAGMNSLVAEVIAILQPDAAGRQIHWKISSLSPAECDPVLVKQVFQNLISNSLKYSRTREQPVIEIGETIQEGVNIIFVRDNGVGFDMAYADKLFAVFQRLHKASEFEGIGIGLATTQRIIQKHGGHIWAESELEKGATFYFTLTAPQSQTAKGSLRNNLRLSPL